MDDPVRSQWRVYAGAERAVGDELSRVRRKLELVARAGAGDDLDELRDSLERVIRSEVTTLGLETHRLSEQSSRVIERLIAIEHPVDRIAGRVDDSMRQVDRRLASAKQEVTIAIGFCGLVNLALALLVVLYR